MIGVYFLTFSNPLTRDDPFIPYRQVGRTPAHRVWHPSARPPAGVALMQQQWAKSHVLARFDTVIIRLTRLFDQLPGLDPYQRVETVLGCCVLCVTAPRNTCSCPS